MSEPPDPAWRATGYRYHYEGHDQQQEVKARQRAELYDAQRMELAAKRSEPVSLPKAELQQAAPPKRRRKNVISISRPA